MGESWELTRLDVRILLALIGERAPLAVDAIEEQLGRPAFGPGSWLIAGSLARLSKLGLARKSGSGPHVQWSISTRGQTLGSYGIAMAGERVEERQLVRALNGMMRHLSPPAAGCADAQPATAAAGLRSRSGLRQLLRGR